uniref:NADH-ubiquinone oxidoreductase chain 4L n=1 Tax=Helopeltis sp. TaxID=2931293 RepID=A0A8T9ZZK8_9HEMI|nr:NADH dehydrogenase subunit 4L [Helopeltis sp.]
MNFISYNLMYIVYFMMYCFGLLVFMSMLKHVFITLMALEYMVLSIYMFMILMMKYMYSDMYMILVFLVFSVCEGVLGLSLLISMIRCYGNDKLNHLSLMW